MKRLHNNNKSKKGSEKKVSLRLIFQVCNDVFFYTNDISKRIKGYTNHYKTLIFHDTSRLMRSYFQKFFEIRYFLYTTHDKFCLSHALYWNFSCTCIYEEYNARFDYLHIIWTSLTLGSSSIWIIRLVMCFNDLYLFPALIRLELPFLCKQLNFFCFFVM